MSDQSENSHEALSQRFSCFWIDKNDESHHIDNGPTTDWPAEKWAAAISAMYDKFQQAKNLATKDIVIKNKTTPIWAAEMISSIFLNRKQRRSAEKRRRNI